MGVLAVLVVACVTGLVDQPHHTRHHIVCLARVHHTAQGVVCCATLLLLFDGNQWPPCWCAHPLPMCMPSHHTPHAPSMCVWLCGMCCGVVGVVVVAGRGARWCGWTSVWMDGHGGDKEMGFQSTHHTPMACCGEMRCTRWWQPCNTPTTAPQP